MTILIKFINGEWKTIDNVKYVSYDNPSWVIVVLENEKRVHIPVDVVLFTEVK